MSYCSNCIHYKVCGNEGVDDSAMTFCADKQISGDLISRQAVLDLAKDLTFEGGCKHRCIDVTEVYHLPSAEKTASEKLEDIIVGYEIQNIYDLLTKHTALLNDIKMTLTSGKQNNSVLEDIKAEIEVKLGFYTDSSDSYYNGEKCGLEYALDIIDKHIKERKNNGKVETQS